MSGSKDAEGRVNLNSPELDGDRYHYSLRGPQKAERCSLFSAVPQFPSTDRNPACTRHQEEKLYQGLENARTGKSLELLFRGVKGPGGSHVAELSRLFNGDN